MDHLVELKFQETDDKVKNPDFLTDLLGMAETVSTAPTAAPIRFINQFKIYSSGGTYRLYVYDTVGQAWHYATLT